MKSQIKSAASAVGLAGVLSGAKLVALRSRAMAAPVRDSHIVTRYMNGPGPKKLQIGTGTNPLTDWLNTDFTLDRKFVFLDAKKPFPYKDDSFDYVFSEHMITHIPYVSGHDMLREITRVLKPGGVVRIVTPDLRFLIKVYQNPDTKLVHRYISYARDHASDGEKWHALLPAYMINRFVRTWGHQFIYDQETLMASMAAAGLDNLDLGELNKSKHADLSNLENESRMPEGFLVLESLIVEGQKPFYT